MNSLPRLGKSPAPAYARSMRNVLDRLRQRLGGPFAARHRNRPVLDALYGAIMTAARAPALYARIGVPDTVDGRYDMVMLHAYLVIDRLRRGDAAGQALAQDLFDHMFRDMDAALREMGVGDMGIGKRIKKMAAKFYGRAEAYDAGLAGSGPELEDALARNAFPGVEPPPAGVAALAAYMRTARDRLAATPLEAVLAGRIDFPEAPAVPETAA